jgi:DNA (cytosine-5)-methyltransferase 1
LHAVPTPTVCGNYNRKGASATSGVGLSTYVKNLPTPKARDFKSGKQKVVRHSLDLNVLVQQEDGGPLNPEWVEWLMGWPIGHTESGS